MMLNLDQKGLTLIETLVTLGIFSTVVVFTMGLFISANKAQIAASEMNLVNNEASFLIERISREIRMAKETHMTITGGNTIRFKNHDDENTIYCEYKITGPASCSNGGKYVAVSHDGGISYAVINSENTKVTGLEFYANGDIVSVVSPTAQPVITILLTVESKKIPAISTSLQTSVVPRVY